MNRRTALKRGLGFLLGATVSGKAVQGIVQGSSKPQKKLIDQSYLHPYQRSHISVGNDIDLFAGNKPVRVSIYAEVV